MKTIELSCGLGWLLDWCEKNKVMIQEDRHHESYFKLYGATAVGFLNLGSSMHPHVDFKLSLDNAAAFNKIGQVPIVIGLTNLTEEVLNKHWNFIGSPEGYRYSNNFEYLDDENRIYETE